MAGRLRFESVQADDNYNAKLGNEGLRVGSRLEAPLVSRDSALEQTGTTTQMELHKSEHVSSSEKEKALVPFLQIEHSNSNNILSDEPALESPELSLQSVDRLKISSYHNITHNLDLIIEVRDVKDYQIHRFWVSKCILSHSSSIWRNQIDNNEMSILPQQEGVGIHQILELKASVDTALFKDILCVLHHNYRPEGKLMELDRLDVHPLFKICSKYDLAQALMGWTIVWAAQLKHTWTDPGWENSISFFKFFDNRFLEDNIKAFIDILAEECAPVNRDEETTKVYYKRQGFIIDTSSWPADIVGE